MTRKLYAVLVATLVLFATPLAGAAGAADADTTTGNDSSEDTAGNDTAGNDSDGTSMPFGLQVTSFVDSAKENETGPLGPLVASFVTQNNPGNAPDHAGPPAWLFGGSDENDTDANESDERGPPDDAGPPEDGEHGPPDDAGPDGDDKRGPPGDTGPGDDDDADTPEDPEPDTDETDEDESERGGPPDDAGPPANAGPA